jgi:hypothetical protein
MQAPRAPLPSDGGCLPVDLRFPYQWQYVDEDGATVSTAATGALIRLARAQGYEAVAVRHRALAKTLYVWTDPARKEPHPLNSVA